MQTPTQITLAWELAAHGLRHTKIAAHLGRHREAIGLWLKGIAIDTIRVFTSTDLPTAQMIRDRIKALQASGEQAGTTVKTRSVANTVQSLRRSLATVATRGIIVVADTTTPVPGEISAPPVPQTPPTMPEPASTVAAPEQLTALSPVTPAVGEPTPQVVASSASAADWTAASLTIMISD